MIVHCEGKLVPLRDLKPHPKNRNEHPKDQLKRLADILKYQGWRYPIKVSNRSGFITSGHGRLEAAKLNGWTEAPVSFQEYEDETQEYADLTADNAIASWAELDLAGVNDDVLALGEFNIDLLGIKDFELKQAGTEGESDPDEVPENPPAITKPGDLYTLGNHRLLCGDSTKREDVERLMAREKADMVFTDPPYGMKAVESSGVLKGKYRAIAGDESPDLAKKAFQEFGKTPGVWWGANYYCSVLPDASKWLVWDKNNGGSDQTDCELAWSNLHGVVRQFTQASEKVNRVHPTQKPVSLIEWAFGFHDGNIVFDPFLGSGSTLIACEKTNRRCFGMEIDPHYCDVIVARWEKFTGKKAELQ